VTDEVAIYSFEGFEIRARDSGGDDGLLLNARDVIFALGLLPGEPASEWVDVVDAHIIAKLAGSEESSRFRIWLNEGLGRGPSGGRAAKPAESSPR
jgi:hypothetical protein